MSMKIKNVLLIIMLLMLCGCGVRENVIINNDDSIVEKIFIYEDNATLLKEPTPLTDTIDNYLKPYKSKIIKKGYKYKFYSTMFNTGVILTKKYSNICDYVNNSIFINKLYSSNNCTKDNSYYKVNTGVLDTNNDILKKYDNLSFYIKSDKGIEYGNYNFVNNKNYKWDIDKNNSNKRIIVYVKKQSFLTKILYRIKSSKILGIIILVLIGCGILYLGYLRLYKKFLNNRISY